MSFRLCQNCWNYYRKYAGLQSPTRLNDTEIELKKRPIIELDDDKSNDLTNKQQHK